MKIALALLCATGASAFAPSPFAVGRASTAIMAEKINEKIDLESAKVVNNECLDPGKKGVYCRCWKSETFPLCDAAHVKHNEATGDNVGPLIVSAAKAE
jgi:CDGSH-type Zn-finger protein